MGKSNEIVVNLRRSSPSEPWGFSLVGGSDVKAPLIVTRVGYGSPAEGVLQRGDIISKVGNYDARDIRHQDAQTLFKNAGSNIRVVVQRENNPRQNTSTGSSRTSSHNYSPLSVSPHLSPRGGNYPSPLATGAGGYSPGGSALTPYYASPLTPIDNNYFDPVYLGPGGGSQPGAQDEDIHVTKQPYRTTPLVLPGAKVKREPGGPTESYLRHHPNPSVRAPPHHLDAEHHLRQKLVHKQFNSPINLYSEPNIHDTIQKQTGITPIKKQVKFNPADSETYRAIQEEQLGDKIEEVRVPAQSKVYAPNKTIPAKKAPVVVNQNPTYANSIGNDPEVIQQSGSFKRLMWSVLPEHSY